MQHSNEEYQYDSQHVIQSFHLGDPHFAPPPTTLAKPKNLIQAQFMGEEIGQLPTECVGRNVFLSKG